jgi:hypothetical protein
MVGAKAPATVPLPGKYILQPKDRLVNPYSGKGLQDGLLAVLILCREASLFPQALLPVDFANLVI